MDEDFYERPRDAALSLSGEASPGYIVYHDVPGRIHASVPGVRLLAVLRDPVDRAYSAYEYHYLRHMRETSNIDPDARGHAEIRPRPMTFLELAQQEIEHLKRCLDAFAKAHGEGALVDLSDECYKKRNVRQQWPDSRWTTWPFVTPRKAQWVYRSMIARGRYADQLSHYFAEWGKKEHFLHVVCSEDLLEKPAQTMAAVAEFLGLPGPPHFAFDKVVAKGMYNVHGAEGYEQATIPDGWGENAGAAYGQRVRAAIPPEAKKVLGAYFKPHNERLFKMIGKRCRWMSGG